MNVQKIARILCLLLAVLILFNTVVRPLEVKAANNTSLYPYIYTFDITTSNMGTYELVVWGKVAPAIEYGNSSTIVKIPCPCIVSETWVDMKQSRYDDFSNRTYPVSMEFGSAYTVNGYITTSNRSFGNDSSDGDSSETDPTEGGSTGSGSSGSGSSGSGSSGSGSSGSGSSGSGSSGSGSSGSGSSGSGSSGSGSSGSGSSGSGSSGSGSSDSNSILESISGFLGDIYQNISGIGNTITTSISNALTGFWTDVKSAILSIPSVLTNIWEWVQSIPQTLLDTSASVFVPAEGYLDAKVDTLLANYTFLKSFYSDMNFLRQRLLGLGSTPPVITIPLGNSNTSYSLGNDVVFLDLSWYADYKPTVDSVLSALIWVLFVWKTFLKLPGLVRGLPGEFGKEG